MQEIDREPEPEQIITTIQTSLAHGSRTKVALRLGITRQYFMQHFLGEDNEKGGVFFEAVRGLYAVSVKDPAAFLAITAYLNSLFSEWSEGTESHEPLDDLIGMAVHHISELLKLKGKPGTRHEQVVAASRLQSAATRLTAKLDEHAGTRMHESSG